MTRDAANVIFLDESAGRRRYGRANLDDSWGPRFSEDPAKQYRTVWTADGVQHRAPLAELEILAEPVPMPTTRPTLAYVQREDHDITDYRYETASWYDDVTLKAGTYPVTWVTISYREVPGDHPEVYYASIKVDAIVTHTHTVNRLFTASSSNDEYPNRETKHGMHPYAYSVKAGPYAHGELVVVEPSAEVYPDDVAGFSTWDQVAEHIRGGAPAQS